MNSLQRTLQAKQLVAQRRKDKRAEARIVEDFWERTGWYYVYVGLRALGLKGIMKRVFQTPRVLRLRYVRFAGQKGYVLWEIEDFFAKQLLLLPDPEHMRKLRAMIAENHKRGARVVGGSADERMVVGCRAADASSDAGPTSGRQVRQAGQPTTDN